jgi:hypothetical protein
LEVFVHREGYAQTYVDGTFTPQIADGVRHVVLGLLVDLQRASLTKLGRAATDDSIADAPALPASSSAHGTAPQPIPLPLPPAVVHALHSVVPAPPAPVALVVPKPAAPFDAAALAFFSAPESFSAARGTALPPPQPPLPVPEAEGQTGAAGGGDGEESFTDAFGGLAFIASGAHYVDSDAGASPFTPSTGWQLARWLAEEVGVVLSGPHALDEPTIPDLSDGVVLCATVARLRGDVSLPGTTKEPSCRAESRQNITKALSLLREDPRVAARHLYATGAILAGDGQVIRELLSDIHAVWRRMHVREHLPVRAVSHS